eukprot:RCo046994
MGLLTLLKSLKKTDREARMLFLGLDNSGKTTILRKLSEEDISSTAPTQGFNVKSICHEGFRLNAWDIGGQKAVRAYWQHYLDGTDILVYVVDSADLKRLEETGVELGSLMREEKLARVPVLVLANKQDLANAISSDEIAVAMDLHSIRDRKWQIQACSAKTGSGLNEAMEWALKTITSG